jgi:Outer membrane protein beta-barrel domain
MSGIFLAGIRDDDQSRRSSSPERSVSRILKGTGMPNNKFAVTLCVLLLFTLALHGSASAQSEERKLELGVQVSGIAASGFGDKDTLGGGGRVTYNLTKYVALEGELNYLTANSFDSYQRLQGQFGVKAGLRYKKFGVFGKVRPGFINTKQDFFFQIPCGTVCTQTISATDSYTGFSLDVGGVAEIYPSKRILVRFDVGDTIVNRREPIVFFDSPIFNRQQPPIFFGQSLLAIPGRTSATHNLQLSVGVGFRF